MRNVLWTNEDRRNATGTGRGDARVDSAHAAPDGCAHVLHTDDGLDHACYLPAHENGPTAHVASSGYRWTS